MFTAHVDRHLQFVMPVKDIRGLKNLHTVSVCKHNELIDINIYVLAASLFSTATTFDISPASGILRMEPGKKTT